MIKKRKKPKFQRQYAHMKKKVKKKGWRKPRGMYSKQALKKKSRGARPGIGYRQPKKIRGLHPSGFQDILIRNISNLKGLDPKKHAVRIASTIGKKKRTKIIEEAKKNKLKILNE